MYDRFMNSGAGKRRGTGKGTEMIHEYYYQTPYVNTYLIVGIAAIVAAALGTVLFFTFFKKKNEGKFTGAKGKLYNFMNLNRFYAEEILRFLYIFLTCIVTAAGIVTIITGSFLMGFMELVAGNIGLRVVFELLMMFIILCRKTVHIDKKLAGIEKYYDDGYDEYCAEEEEFTEDAGTEGEAAEGAGATAADEAKKEAYRADEENNASACGSSCEGCTGCGPEDIPF